MKLVTSIEDINDLVALAQLLKNEDGKADINGIANNMLDILEDIKRGHSYQQRLEALQKLTELDEELGWIC